MASKPLSWNGLEELAAFLVSGNGVLKDVNGDWKRRAVGGSAHRNAIGNSSQRFSDLQDDAPPRCNCALSALERAIPR